MDEDQFDLSELSAVPRDYIPDEWAHRGPCPVCGVSNSLDVHHPPEAPDQFICQNCDAAFEIATKGSIIRVVTLPEALKPAWMDVINRWMKPKEVQRLYRRYAATQHPVSRDDGALVPERSMPDGEVMVKAQELQRLGNDSDKIEMLLLQSGATSQQVDEALKRLEQQKISSTRWRGCMLRVMWAVTAFVLFMILGVLWVTSRPAVNEGEIVETTAVDSIFTQLDPAEVLSEIIGLPTPEVLEGGPAISNCPGTPVEAAELFGGEERFWSRDAGFNAWAMVNTGAPVTIRVPANMVAGYMNLDSMEMTTVQGPVTIQNLNFIVISCE